MHTRSISDCFILGSGSSLRSLSAEEIDYINRSKFVLTFNKYLIFYKMIGAVPTHYLLGDDGRKSNLTIRETVKICLHDKMLDFVQFILNKIYQLGTPEHEGRLRELKTYLEESDIVEEIEALRSISHRCKFIERYDMLQGGKWAKSLDEKIFHFRGSLSGAINIANILNPGMKIKLLGVDLDTHEYFCHQELMRDRKKWGVLLDRKNPEDKEHFTMVPTQGVDGIQKEFPFMREQVRASGGDLICCNPQSFLVRTKILEYKHTID